MEGIVKKFFAEMLGTLIMVWFTCGFEAQNALISNMEEMSMVNIIISVCLAIAIYMTGGISGGHLNPAVSLAKACLGKLEWKHFLVYIIAQFLGAFLGAAVVFGIYYDAIMVFTNRNLSVSGSKGSGHIFASYPAGPVSIQEGLYLQVVAVAMLVLAVLAITKLRNHAAGVELAIIAFGLKYDYPLNPATDLGPRLFTAVAGWGMEVFTYGNYWWWIPVVGPLIGSLISAFLYNLVIKHYHIKVVAKMEIDNYRSQNTHPMITRLKLKKLNLTLNT
ncbi:aquaporin-9-like [Gouania willdenowi]|uniref:aquaporin-9-like n=1 Tax=Gouania willdenowi TaxID=441366 RepID=UPI001054CB8A|nr:aquaporin-9-like [Gouania willdenowi]